MRKLTFRAADALADAERLVEIARRRLVDAPNEEKIEILKRFTRFAAEQIRRDWTRRRPRQFRAVYEALTAVIEATAPDGSDRE